MSDAIDIRDGGVVAVDTAELRAAASVLAGLADGCETLRAEVASICAGLAAHDATAWTAAELASGIVAALDHAAVEAAALARSLRATADVYEIVELEAANRAAALAGEAGSSAALARRLAAAREADPRAAARADLLLATWPLTRHRDLLAAAAAAVAPLGMLGAPGPAAVALTLAAVGGLGLGRVSSAERSIGAPVPVRVGAYPAAPAPAPGGLGALAARIPSGDDQVRVERYARAGGDVRYAVYVGGTRSPFGLGGVEPLDLTSNLQLYGGIRSASYDGVVAALRDAGARPGDEVLAIGYSQGGAITSRLALDGPFRVVGNVTFGSPVQAQVPDATLDVTIRHLDDPVAALQAGGHPTAVGSAGGFVVERVAERGAGLSALALGAHSMAEYAETAQLADESADPRTRELRALLATLDGGGPADVATYHLRRPDG